MLGFVDKKSNRIDDRITTGFSQHLLKMPLPNDSRFNYIKTPHQTQVPETPAPRLLHLAV